MKVYTYIYSGSYLPPAPIVEIGIRGPDPNSRAVHLTALIDSGSLDGPAQTVEIAE